MRDKHLVAVTATFLIVFAAGFALTAGGEQANPQAATTDRTAEETTGVTLHGVTVDRLQLQNTTIENATVDRLTVDQLTGSNRTISNGTFVDAELSSLQLPGVTAEELTGESAPETQMGNETQMGTDTPGATTPAAETPGELAQMQPTPETATPDTETGTATGTETSDTGIGTEADTETGEPANQTAESDRIGRVRIATLSVEEIEVDSLTFEEGDTTTEGNATAPEGEGTPAEPETETGTPLAPGTETPAEPESPAETPGEAGTATVTGSPLLGLQNQPDTPQETPDTTEESPGGAQETPDTTEEMPDGEEGTGEGQSVVVGRMNVTTLTVGEMVVTTAVSNASSAAQTGTAQATPADTDSMPAGESGTTPTQQTPDTGEMAADITVPQLDVDSASAERVSARMTGTFGQFYVAATDIPDEVEAGENYTVTVTVVNADDERGSEYVGYQLGMAVPMQDLIALDPGERQSVTINATAEDLTAGTYTVSVVTQRSTMDHTLTVTNDTEAVATEATPEEEPTTETPLGPETETPGDETPTEAETEAGTPTEGETPTETGAGTPVEEETPTETETPGGPL